MANIKGGESRGKVVYNESIVKGIVAIAVSSVEGVAANQGKNLKDGIKIVSDKDGIYVSATVNVLHGYNIPDVAYNIQNSIKESVESMSKYRISKVDVFVSDVVFDEKTATETQNN